MTTKTRGGTCATCGCTEDAPCEGGCAWTDETESKCSACEEARLERCDRCGGECYDFKQWMGGFRTCITCTEHLLAVEACMLVCEHCLEGYALAPLAGPRCDDDGKLTPRYHQRSHLGPGGLCTAARFRERYGLGDGPLSDWITDRLSESTVS